MTTELEELATRAANDRSPAGAELEEVIRSVIEKTRRHWATAAGPHPASGAAAGDCAALKRSGGGDLPWRERAPRA